MVRPDVGVIELAMVRGAGYGCYLDWVIVPLTPDFPTELDIVKLCLIIP